MRKQVAVRRPLQGRCHSRQEGLLTCGGLQHGNINARLHGVDLRQAAVDLHVEDIGSVVVTGEIVAQLHLNATFNIAVGIQDALLRALEQGRLRPEEGLRRVAARHDASPAQVALAWTLRHENVVSIPKAARRAHVLANAKAADLVLTEEDLADIDRAFPPPRRDMPLETL